MFDLPYCQNSVLLLNRVCLNQKEVTWHKTSSYSQVVTIIISIAILTSKNIYKQLMQEAILALLWRPS